MSCGPSATVRSRLLGAACAAWSLWLGLGATAQEKVDYQKQVKPILMSRCVACHGALRQEGGLRLDTAALAKKGGDGGAAIKPGDVTGSPLLQRVTTTDEAQRMPQEGEPLRPEQIATLRLWISQNAAAPADEQPEQDPREHWAFRMVVRPAVPRLQRSTWPINAVDAFIGQQHERLSLVPQAEAPRPLLVRRLYLDLVGMPPTADELAKIDQDRGDDWYDRLVRQLLDDPRYGERWGRHWMDIWRYSDWWGLGSQLRNSQLHLWHWRDWIIESLNADLPYDEMIRLMLAADELYPNDLDRLRATGFLARNYFLFNRNQWMDETVEHVSKSFVGLTMNCTKCHDHKYDPFSQTDFYRLRAFFEPYHVRLDMVPGEADLARDGIPRVFDGLLDAPTYRLIRGQEGQPDKSQVIAPGVPELLAFKDLAIQPLTLPPEAWQPERRAWVGAAYQVSAQKAVAAAEAAVKTAGEKLTAARKREMEVAAAPPAAKPTTNDTSGAAPAMAALVERFQTLDPKRWKLFGGDWAHSAGRLEQKRDGASRAALRLVTDAPQNFDVTVRFTILGGSRWRSVSVGFDCTQADPSATPGNDDSEQTVYVSAVAGGSKVQAAFHQGGVWKYPTEAMQPRPIELKHEYTLRVQVRDTLINASLDGQPVLAWHTTLPRRAGALQLTTFDALTVFHEVTIAPLAANVPLREPGGPPTTAPVTPDAAKTAVADAELELRIAELGVATAQAELQSIRCRAEASRAGGADTTPGQPDDAAAQAQRDAVAQAVRAERQVAVAKARQALGVVELRHLRAAADKKEPVEKELKAAREALQKAEQAAAAEVAPTDKFTPLIGARWTATRFMNSGADDPLVKFSPQSSGRRRALAEWITDRRNPLTARVAVNHVWMRHLGTPLVATVFEFGRKGSPPTHPELLDWLAAEFMDNGWSMKHLHRLIVTSATYRMSSSVVGREANVAIDPENRCWWRRAPVRVESQVVRDSILSLAGTLDLSRGGPPVPTATQAESTRRSLYFFHSNNERNLFLTTFDEAAVKECYRRDQSIVPQQALALTNSRLVLDAAGKIAARISQMVGDEPTAANDASFVRQAFTLVLGITAGDAEVAASLKAFAAWRQLPDSVAKDARAQLIWVLLNHNDFVTVR